MKKNKVPDPASVTDIVEKQKLSGYGRWKNENAVKPTYNIYSDVHIKQNKSKAKRQELWQKLQKDEEKERKDKIALTKEFLPQRGSNVLVEELRTEESENRLKIATSFFDLPISDRTKEGLLQAGYSQMTVIQRASIPHSIAGRDVLGAAKTGSGKTLAFVIPLLELLWREKVTQEAGLSAIILTPTRELAVQIFETLRLVGKFHESISAGLLIGGPKNYKEETQAVGLMNILIATPGRLLQHFSETAIDTNCFKMLIFDEADRMMDMGFKKEIDSIIEYLPPDRQTLLFSATQSASVTNLSRLSLNEPEYVAAHARAQQATPTTLQQYYTVVELFQKTNTLWSFLKSHIRDKIIIFFASQKEVAYYHDSFKDMAVGMRLLQLHGHMSQRVRTKIYYDFNEHVGGGGVCLFTTDVASRGLDFESVSWIIQFDCPEDSTAYIHRVGRTARKEQSGNALMLILPSEKAIVADIEAKKIPLKCIELNPTKQEDIQLVLQNTCVKDPLRKLQAQKCFRSYVRSTDIGDHKYFKRDELPLEKYAQSIGLYTVPNLAEKYEKFDKNEARMLDHMKDLLKAQEDAEILGEEIPLTLKKKHKSQSDLLLKRKNTDVFSKSAQSLVNVDEESEDDLFTKKTENKFHEIMEVDKLVLDPKRTSSITLDDLDLPLDDKGDDYYDQIEEELQGQDSLDRKAALALIAEKKRQQKQRRHNYEKYVKSNGDVEEEVQNEEEIESIRKNSSKTPNQKFSGIQKKKKHH